MTTDRPNLPPSHGRPPFVGPRPPRQKPRERRQPPPPQTARLRNDDGTPGPRVAVLHPTHTQALLTLAENLGHAVQGGPPHLGGGRPLILPGPAQEALAVISSVRKVADRLAISFTPAPTTTTTTSPAPGPTTTPAPGPTPALSSSPGPHVSSTGPAGITGRTTPLARVLMAATSDLAAGYAPQAHKYTAEQIAQRCLEEHAVLVALAAAIHHDVRWARQELTNLGAGLCLSWQCVYAIVQRLADRGLIHCMNSGTRDHPSLLISIDFDRVKTGYRKNTTRRVATRLPSAAPAKTPESREQRAENREQRTESTPQNVGPALPSPLSVLPPCPPCPHHGGAATPAHQCPTCARLRQIAQAHKAKAAAAHQMDLFGDHAA